MSMWQTRLEAREAERLRRQRRRSMIKAREEVCLVAQRMKTAEEWDLKGVCVEEENHNEQLYL